MDQDTILMPCKNMAQLLTKFQDDNFFPQKLLRQW
jgi:hypothetical protein